MNINAIEFGLSSPVALLWAAVLIFFMFWFFRKYQLKKSREFLNADLWPKLALIRPEAIFWSKTILTVIAWILLVVALMQPIKYGNYPVEIRQPSQTDENKIGKIRRFHPVYFFLDDSASMSVKDMPGGISRFDYAKQVLDQLLRDLNGEAIALNVFTSEVMPLVPLTNDYLFARLILRQLQINEGGTQGTDLSNLFKYFKENDLTAFASNPKTVVLISDGEDNQMESGSSDSNVKRMDEILQSIPADKDLKIFTVGIGTTAGGEIPNFEFQGQPVQSSLDEEILTKISQKGQGVFYKANQFSILDLSKKISNEIERANAFVTSQIDVKKEMLVQTHLFQIPLAVAIILLLFVLLGPDTYVKSTIVILLISVNSLFSLGPSPEAYFKVKEYSEVLKFYENLSNQNLQPWQETFVLYNIGTTHLASGNPKSAIEILNSISLEQAPLLIYQTKGNLALAYIVAAEQEEGGYETALALLQKAKNELDKANIAYCDLVRFKGYQHCSRAYQLDLAQNKLENAKINIMLRSSPEAFLLGSLAVQQLESKIDFLSKMGDEKLKNEYLNKLKAHTHSIENYLSKLKVKIEYFQDTKKAYTLYEDALKAFQRFRQLVEDAKIQESLPELAGAKTSLEELSKLPVREKPATPKIEQKTNQQEPSKTDQEAIMQLLQMSQEDRIPIPKVEPKNKVSKPW